MDLIGTMTLRQDVYTRLADIQKAIVPKLIHRADGHCVWSDPLQMEEVAVKLRGIANHIAEHTTPSNPPQPKET